MTDILSTEDYELCGKLKAMRFSGMAEALEELLRDPNSDLIPFREKVGRLVDAEWDLRYNKKLKPWWKKILSILLRCIAWLLVLAIAAVGIISALGYFGIIDIPVAEDVLVSLGLAEQYHVTSPDADEYFNNNSKVIAVIDANMSNDVLTEAQTFEILTERGFTEFSITSDYTMDGTYYDAADILETSTSKHPVYETYYVTGSGDIWTIIMINGRIMANPVSYNLQSNHGVQVIISETDTVTSYDGTTNQFYETIPLDTELIVKIVKRIDAETLESLTYGVIDGL